MSAPLQEIRIGTRGSQLALWQANTVAAALAAAGAPPTRLVIIKTSGDRLQDAPLSEIGGKRLFVKEIEDALIRNEIDAAVHSSKDMPAVLPDGLTIGAVLPRENPFDAVVLRAEGPATLQALTSQLGRAPSIGTGSVRRIAQLTRLFPSARFSPIRGNLDTRLRKLDNGDYDALVLAAAGLRRLGFGHRIAMTLPLTACVPAPGQGIVAIEIRSGDSPVQDFIARVNDEEAAAALEAERAVVEGLGGGCQTPIGALAVPIDDREIELVAAVIAIDGSRLLRASLRGAMAGARAMGAQAAQSLLAQGAAEILGAPHAPTVDEARSAALSDE